MWKEKIRLAVFVSILFFLMPSGLTAQAPCDDDDDIIIGSFSYSGSVCPGGTVFLMFTLTPEDDDDGDGFYDVTYSFGGQEFTLLDVATGHVVGHTVNIPTTAVFISILNDDANCINTVNQSIAIQVLPSLIISIGNLAQPACGQANGSFTAQGSGGTSPYQYSLDGFNFQSSGTFSGLGAGNYTVTVRDANGCTGQQAITLNNSSNLVIILTESTAPDCKNDNGTIRVSAQGGSPPYIFSIDGINFQSNPLFDGLGPGQYVVYSRDNQGCISSLEVTWEDPLAGLTAAQATTSASIICLGEAFNLIANLPAGTTGSWSVDREGITITSPSSPVSSAVISDAGNYVLTWTLSTADCDGYSSVSVTLTVIPTPVAQQDGPVLVNGQDVEIMILGNDVHLPGATISILQTPSQGVATLNDTSINYTPDMDAAGADTLIYQICQPDCELLCDTAMVIVMNADGSEICDLNAAPDNVFPEGITPNGDEFNDQLEFIVVDPTSCPFNFANSELIIFNRWGDRVFEAAPYNNDWNGRSQAGELPAGVYYYVLKIRLEQEFVKFGNVSIFR